MQAWAGITSYALYKCQTQTISSSSESVERGSSTGNTTQLTSVEGAVSTSMSGDSVPLNGTAISSVAVQQEDERFIHYLMCWVL